MEEIQRLLWDLGIGARYRGYWYSAAALKLAVSDPTRLSSIKKSIYLPVAEEYQTTWENVERNIRTTVRICWEQGNRELLEVMAGRTLFLKPTVCEFLDIVTNYLLRKTEHF